MPGPYAFAGSETIASPALIYYRKQIEENTRMAIEMAGGADRLWPHVKTHKTAEVIRMSMALGITRYKCATIAEAEMTAACGASHIVLSYPLIGPNVARFLALVQAFPETHFYAIGDDPGALTRLGSAALASGCNVDVLVDVNMGMNRTGVPLSDLPAFCDAASGIAGITLRGFHCYDGHRTEPDYTIRQAEADKINQSMAGILQSIQDQHPAMEILIIGGSPSFPCHKVYENAYLSPGTVFVYDYGYAKKYKDLPFVPAAAILTRVVSRPAPGYFSIDTGYKAISADPEGLRGQLLGVDNCEVAFQSEEHWTYRMLPGYESECPQVGDELFVIPTHICPTTALYDSVVVVEDGQIIDTWEVTARNRRITY